MNQGSRANLEISVPGKVFLLGEYLALCGGPALVAAVGPRFRLSVLWGDDGESLLPTLKGIFHPQSLAGRRWESAELEHSFPLKPNQTDRIELENQIDFENQSGFVSKATWEDPFKGKGGFGASTAEFAVSEFAAKYLNQLYLNKITSTSTLNSPWNLCSNLLNSEEFLQDISSNQTILDFWKSYRTVCQKTQTKGPLPSGYDLIAQLKGGVSLICSSFSGEKKELWSGDSFSNAKFVTAIDAGISARDLAHSVPLRSLLLFQSTQIEGRKVATHDHLENLRNQKFPIGFSALLNDLQKLVEDTVSRSKEISQKFSSQHESVNKEDELGKLWGLSFSKYAEYLASSGLECEAARKDRQFFCTINGVYGAKGTGALLADGFLVAVENSSEKKSEIIQAMKSRGQVYLGCLGENLEKGLQCCFVNSGVSSGINSRKESLSRPRSVWVKAPSNIAWIKYMGKKNQPIAGKIINIPENSSLSMTLSSLCTHVNLVLKSRKTSDQSSEKEIGKNAKGAHGAHGTHGAVPKKSPPREYTGECDWSVVFDSQNVGQNEIDRMERYLDFLDQEFPRLVNEFSSHSSQKISSTPPVFEVETFNTFPSASGIASSASAFAAWTIAWISAHWPNQREFESLWKEDGQFRLQLASLSRDGSGSSCRSFLGPFVKWNSPASYGYKKPLQSAPEIETLKVDPVFEELTHFVLVVSSQKKEVSSSEAHRRVKTSPLWGEADLNSQNNEVVGLNSTASLPLAPAARAVRAEKRLLDLTRALGSGNLEWAQSILWQEFFDMHSLFHTADPAFTYWQSGTMECLNYLQKKYFTQNGTAELKESEEVSVTEEMSSEKISEGIKIVPLVTMDAGPNVHVSVSKRAASYFEDEIQRDLISPSRGKISILKDTSGSGPEVSFIEPMALPQQWENS